VQCGESPQDFYANFGGDPLLMKHRMTASCGHCFSYGFTVRQVIHRIGPSCGLYMTALTEDPWYGMNLKLHHRQMHYRQSPFLNVFTKKMETKGVKNTPPEHKKLRIYLTKSHLRGVNLVGLSLKSLCGFLLAAQMWEYAAGGIQPENR